MKAPNPAKQIEEKYAKVLSLMHFAMGQLDPPEEQLINHIFVYLDRVERRRTSIQSESWESFARLSADLDILIRELIKITHPFTAEKDVKTTQVYALALKINYKWISYYISVIALAVVILSYFRLQSTVNPSIWAPILAIALGTLGSGLYLWLNLSSTRGDFTLISTVVLGAINGWLLYFGLLQSEFIGLISGPTIQVLLPFFAGFSARPILIFLVKMVYTLETIIGIADQ